MTLLVLIAYLLGVFTGWLSKNCILIREAQKGRAWFGEHEEV